jgi:hypothetical protein
MPLPRLALTLLALCALAALSGCGGRAEATGGGLPPLPADGPYVPRHTSATTTLNGADALLTSGAPGVQPHAQFDTWLTLDGDLAGELAWAIWRIDLGPGFDLASVSVNVQQSGLKRYWLLYADYTSGRWEYVYNGTDPLGEKGVQGFTPADPQGVRSPAHYAYVAVLVLPTQGVNVGLLEVETTFNGTLTEPIFDTREDNDSLDEAQDGPLLLGPGQYFASVHESPIEGWTEFGERIDKYDYCLVSLQAGETLTATLKHDAADPLGVFSGSMDLDLLFYNPGATRELDDFIESASGVRIHFYNFEQVTYTASSAGWYPLGVIAVPDIDEEAPDSAEYELNLFINPAGTVYEVRGNVTIDDAMPDHSLIVVLEPGNFSALSTGADQPVRGQFTIPGVPNGEYTLKVYGNAGYEPTGWVWPESETVTVNNGDVAGAGIDLSPAP